MSESTTDMSAAEGPVKRGVRQVFFGEDGLRAGWSALLFVVIAIGIASVANVALIFLFHLPRVNAKEPLSPGMGVLTELLSVLSVAVAAWTMARIEDRPITVYGYAGKARVARFLWGAVWGFVALSSLVAVLWQAHFLSFGGALLHGSTAWGYGVAWLLVFVLVGIFEESLLRGYLQHTLTRGIGFWWGALLMSILFGAIHGNNKGESPIGLFSAGGAGLLFCISLWYTGSLWWAIGFHATWDWAQSFFYGTPDSGMVTRGHLLAERPVGPLLWSGGPTGPEGSVFVVPLLALIAAAMWLWWGRRSQLRPGDSPYPEVDETSASTV